MQFHESLLGDDISNCTTTIYDALLPRVMAGTPSVNPDDLVVSVAPSCPSFQRVLGCT